MKTPATFFGAVLLSGVIAGQTSVDSSGNAMLKGAYHFRQVAVLGVDTNGNPVRIQSAFGVITFDGKKSYSLSATLIDNTNSQGSPEPLTATSGTYAIGANGLGYISNPLLPTANLIYGSVAEGVFTGSDTEDGNINDMFVAIPAGAPLANTGFTNSYSAGLLDFAGAGATAIKNALFNLNPDGQGALASITATGQAAGRAGSITQVISGGTYNFENDGTATLKIPLPPSTTAANALFAGTKSMYVSSDGNFILGWTPSGYDLFFGVSSLKTPSSNSIYQGTYYLTALEDAVSSGGGTDAYYGSALAAHGDGNEIIHQRRAYFGTYAQDVLLAGSTQINSNGITPAPDTNGYQYAFGDGGKAFVAIGTSGLFSLLIGLQAPNLSGAGVFLNPTGVFNAASYAPITSGIAPGELITLFGSGLATATLSITGGLPFPSTLGGVQVLMNGNPAPIYYVSPTQVSAIVPYSLTPNPAQFVATIQVSNSGALSNPVTVYLTDSLPGVFTQNLTGLGYGAALHAADSSLVTPGKPAVAGEFLEVFLTGLGAVAPAVADGALGPSNPPSASTLFTASNLTVNFIDAANHGFRLGKVNFAGLAPTLAGLYQINVQVPAGLGPGDVFLEVVTDFADVRQVKIPVGATSVSNGPDPQDVTPVRPALHAPLRPQTRRRALP